MSRLVIAQKLWMAIALFILHSAVGAEDYWFHVVQTNETSNTLWGRVGPNDQNQMVVKEAHYGVYAGDPTANGVWNYDYPGAPGARFVATLCERPGTGLADDILVLQGMPTGSAVGTTFEWFVAVLQVNQSTPTNPTPIWRPAMVALMTNIDAGIEETTIGEGCCIIPDENSVEGDYITIPIGPDKQLIIVVNPDGTIETWITETGGPGCYHVCIAPSGIGSDGYIIYSICAQSNNGPVYIPPQATP
jgi:hypothetical protein